MAILSHSFTNKTSEVFDPSEVLNPDAANIMKIINAAYEVLSDPEKRRAHDLWIAQQEMDSPETVAGQTYTDHSSGNSKSTQIPSDNSSIRTGDILRQIFYSWI